MAEYIEREALKQRLGDLHFQNYGNAILAVMEAPAADVVEVVRCRQCKHRQEATYRHGRCVCERLSRWVMDDQFCDQGERREQNA